MGVYISCMEVPESCNKCRLSYLDQEEGYLKCAVLRKELVFCDPDKRCIDCPLTSTKKEPFGEWPSETTSPTNSQQWAFNMIQEYHFGVTGKYYDKPEFNKQAYRDFISQHAEEYDLAKQKKHKETSKPKKEYRTYSCDDNTLFDWGEMYDAPDIYFY